MTPDQWLAMLNAVLVGVAVYTAIRVDMAVLRVKLEHQTEKLDKIEKSLEK